MQRQSINSCMYSSIWFFATITFQFFSVLAISCMILLEELTAQFHLSIQTNLVSSSLLCKSTCLVYKKSLRLKRFIDLLKSKVGISLFLNLLHSTSASASIQFSLSHHLSSNDRVNFSFPLGDFLRFSPPFSECTTFVSRSLFRSDCEQKNRCCNRFSDRNCPSFLEAWSTRHMICHLFPEAWRSES